MLKRFFIVIAICVFYYTFSTHSRICEDVVIRNNITNLKKELTGCSKINGFLNVALLEHTNTSSFENISFPTLTEVTGYVLFYRIHGLTSIGKLLPNLTVIRGLSLFTDYSLVIYELNDLKEIGLRNLRYIARGSTRIERCSQLCYVHTVDWNKIGNPDHNLVYFNTSDEKDFCQIPCPLQCQEEYCWNANYCQDNASSYKCHYECLGCTASIDPRKCIACRSFNNNGRCVNRCPKDKLLHKVSASCVTEFECKNMYPHTWWIYNRECTNECTPGYERPNNKGPNCIPCKDYCSKICDGFDVESISAAENFRGCTIINGSLSLRVDTRRFSQELAKNFEYVEVIKGFLRIYRSSALSSLEFFKRLKEIQGNELYNTRYALAVYENSNLYRLWNWDNFKMKIRYGTIMFHYNSQLCPLEIDMLSNLTGVNYTKFEVSPYSNGDQRECNYIDLHVNLSNLTATNVTFDWEKFITNDKNHTVIGYFLYYAQDPYKNMTIYGEQEECDGNNWESIFVLGRTKQQVLDLNAYTQYAYYIKTYTTNNLLDGQTRINHFTTLSEDPSELLDVVATSTSSDTIHLSWKPPMFPNGGLDHHNIILYYIHDDENFASHRNYCKYGHNYVQQSTVPQSLEYSISKDHAKTFSTDDGCCKKDNKDFDFICVVSFTSKECGNNLYSTKDNIIPSDNYTFVLLESHKLTKRTAEYDYPTNTTDLMEKTIPGNFTSYVLDELKHFGLYSIVISVCNKKTDKQCSSSIMVSQRTLLKEDADDIPSEVIVDVDRFSLTLKWMEPREPNAFIVSYHVEHQRTDVPHSKTVTECLRRSKFVNNGHKYYIKNFLPGEYSLRVRAVSLAGPGRFSKYVKFEIEVPYSGPSIAIVVLIIVCIIVLILMGLFYYYQYYYRNKDMDHQHLLSSGSSDYSGPVYVEDNWELDRDDVEICNEIGQGTFGMVYTGFIRSQNRACAIKTMNQQVDIHEKMVFLNEASVMKAFSNAHHVVKLLGVVSRGQPPLVVMELMTREDLKSFLRKTRSSSTKTTCAEMYRMSAEIADGMMYLAAKKFVHRDLAARNCMVSADHTVKIGDFGMTRDIYATDYYRKESGGLMPIRWMSPESLADGVFTIDSDVWSYGVLLWEIVTFAELPYQGLANEQVLQFVIAQGTLERPTECPDLLYEIMVACWNWQPNFRPTFPDIVDKLESHIGQHFRFVSFYHSAEGEEYRMTTKERAYNVPALSSPFNRNTAIYWNAFDDDISI